MDEDSMSVIRRIFREVGAEGRSMSSLRMALNREGVRTTDGKGGGRKYFYYRCPTRGRHGPHHACVNGRHHRAEPLEDHVWGFVAGLLKDPDRLRAGLERMVERERASSRGNPDEEVRAWVERLGQIDRKRSGFQDMAAEGLITIDELRAKLATLEEGRKTATAEVERIRERAERARALESDKEALLRTYSAMVPAGLDALNPDERRRVYGMLRLKVEVAPDGAMHARGVLSEPLDAAREDGASLRENGLASSSTIWFRPGASVRQRPA